MKQLPSPLRRWTPATRSAIETSVLLCTRLSTFSNLCREYRFFWSSFFSTRGSQDGSWRWMAGSNKLGAHLVQTARHMGSCCNCWGAKPFQTRFLFVRKYDESGNIIRHKARLVVNVYMQEDVHMKLAPVVDFTSIPTANSVALQNGFLIHQMDVTSAFLHEDIDEHIYLTAPEGVSLRNPGQYLRLRRVLYGLKQAPQLWHDTWLSMMDKIGFKPFISDQCIFQREKLWLLMYVDDIIIISPSDNLIKTLERELHLYLDVKDLDILQSFSEYVWNVEKIRSFFLRTDISELFWRDLVTRTVINLTCIIVAVSSKYIFVPTPFSELFK